MNFNPELYSENCTEQYRDAVELLEEFDYLIKKQQGTVLDIGCGIGNVTWKLLRPKLPLGIRLIGADISKDMLISAKSQYPDLELLELNILTPRLENLKNKFDFVFSNYCFHWIRDQRHLMQNLFKIIKPGGNMLLHYLISHPFYDVFIDISKKQPWKTYMPNMNKYLSLYHYDFEKAENEIKMFLTESGFQVSICKCRNKFTNRKTLRNVKDDFLTVVPYYSDIPQNMKQKFEDDLEEIMWNTFKNYGTYENMAIPYIIIVIYATKP